ncbi:hypothetical protein ACFE04_006027 [Oxalis oulophora]
MVNILLLLPLALSLLFFVNPASGDSKTDELINKICRSGVDYGFCYKVFHENMKSASTDIIGLAEITIEQGLRNSTNNLEYIGNLIRHESNPEREILLIHCLVGYDGALGSYFVASDYLSLRDFVRTFNAVRQAPYKMTDCVGSFATDPDIGGRNVQMTKLMTMAIVTAFILKDGK